MRPISFLFTALFLSFLAAPAAAQIPPHTPGTVCITPSGWCWAETQGTPGSPCGCNTSQGYVSGSLG